MMTRTNKIICDDCGKFVSYKDLADGKATHYMVNPDAYGFEETFATQCARCKTGRQGQKVGETQCAAGGPCFSLECGRLGCAIDRANA